MREYLLTVDYMSQLDVRTNIMKVNEDLGLVFGFAIVCTENGQPYFDLQGDHIPEDVMLKASTDFMKNSRTAQDMHVEGAELPGSIVHAFPLTADIAKSLGIETKTTGLLIAMQPDCPKVLGKFKSGEYTGFSIGGTCHNSEPFDS